MRSKALLVSVICIFFAMAVPMTYGQQIVKIVNNYVLVNTSVGLGQPGDELAVFRVEGNLPVAVARIKIVKISNGRTAATVLELQNNRHIEIGDRVAVPNDRIESLFQGTLFSSPEESRVKEPAVFIPHDKWGIGVGLWSPGTQSGWARAFLLAFRATPLQWGRNSLGFEINYPIHGEADGASDKPKQLDIEAVFRFGIISRLSYELGGGISSVKYPGLDESETHALIRVGFSVAFNTSWKAPGSFFTGLKISKADSSWEAAAVAGFRFGLPI